METENKSVLISIRPKWCELIANGKKTVEVRKTKPKLKTPFKCYIYCTQGDALAMPCLNVPRYTIHRTNDGTASGRRMTAQERTQSDHTYINGKVIGEFICSEIEELKRNTVFNAPALYSQSCLTRDEYFGYIGNQTAYIWHISDLKIYDKPKELSKFRAICRHYDDECCGNCEYYDYANNESYRYEECAVDGLKPITKAPQSWRYVEECEENA